MKRVMGFSYKFGPFTTLAYDVRGWLQNLSLPELYMPIHLSGKTRQMDLQLNFPGQPPIVFNTWCANMNTPIGMLCKRDLLQYKTDDGMCLGVSLGFGRDVGISGAHAQR